MKRAAFLLVITMPWTTGVQAEQARFVIDDDAYSDKIVEAGKKLVTEHKLRSLESLREQVQAKGVSVPSLPLGQAKMDPSDLCDLLRESTFAVGTLYKCPDCGGWHFSSSTGFVLGADGLICTCCHVILEEDNDIKQSYLIAADASGRVFPVQAVVAADPEGDTCVIKINASGLRPLPLRSGVRTGEAVYCLSHPGGYYYMFSQGMVARVNRRSNSASDSQVTSQSDRQSNSYFSRPVLLLNITAEFAPGSSGAPVVDASGNLVGQVASIAEAGEPAEDGRNQPASPSVPIRFCTATEEILHLTNPNLAKAPHSPALRPVTKPKSKMRQ